MKIIDLSHEIRNGMMVFPGDPEISIEEGNDNQSCLVFSLKLTGSDGSPARGTAIIK